MYAHEDSDQTAVFAVHSFGSLGPKVSSLRQWRLSLDWTDAQADLSLCWAHIILLFCWFFFMWRLKLVQSDSGVSFIKWDHLHKIVKAIQYYLFDLKVGLEKGVILV